MLKKSIKKFIATALAVANGSHHNGSPSQCHHIHTEEVSQRFTSAIKGTVPHQCSR